MLPKYHSFDVECTIFNHFTDGRPRERHVGSVAAELKAHVRIFWAVLTRNFSEEERIGVTLWNDEVYTLISLW